MDNGIDKGFCLMYHKLSYRRKFAPDYMDDSICHFSNLYCNLAKSQFDIFISHRLY